MCKKGENGGGEEVMITKGKLTTTYRSGWTSSVKGTEHRAQKRCQREASQKVRHIHMLITT